MGGVCMELENFGERISKLRIAKGVSAREMSLAIGQCVNYVSKIENGKSLPSMAAFLEICDYFRISKSEFFDENNNYPIHVSEFIVDYKRLDNKTQSHMAEIVKGLLRKK